MIEKETYLHVRISGKLKLLAFKKAKKMGLGLSGLVDHLLRNFIGEDSILNVKKKR